MSECKTILPTIHLNGTSREALVHDRRNILNALDEVVKAMCSAHPHGRDYYPQGPDALREAQGVSLERLSRVRALYDEVHKEALAIDRIGDPVSPSRQAEIDHGNLLKSQEEFEEE